MKKKIYLLFLCSQILFAQTTEVEQTEENESVEIIFSSENNENQDDVTNSEEGEIHLNVSGKREARLVTETKAAASTVITAEDLKASGATSVTDVLQENGIVAIEGESGSRQNGDQIYLQGIDISRVLIVVDGQRLRSGGGGGTMGQTMSSSTNALKRIPVSSIERIEIVKGPGSYLWGGDAMGGVIYIQTKRGSGEPGLHGSAGVSYKNNFELQDDNNFVRPYLNLDYGFDKGSIWAGGSFEYGDNWLSEYTLGYTPVGAGKIPNDRDEYANFDVFAGTKWEIENIHYLEISARYQQEDSPLNTIDRSIEENLAKNGLGSLNYSVYLMENMDINFSSGLSYDYEIEKEYSPENEVNEDAYIFNDNSLRVSYYLNDIFSFNGGYSFDFELLDEKNIKKEYNQQSHALFFGGSAVVDNSVDFDITAGIRYQYIKRDGTGVDDKSPLHSYSPEVGIVATPFEWFAVKAHVGRSFSPPSLIAAFGDYYSHQDAFLVASNANLQPESSWGYSGTLEFMPTISSDSVKTMKFSLGLFRNDIQNLVAYEFSGEYLDGLQLMRAKNISKAYTWGVNAGAQASFDVTNFGVLDYTVNFEYLIAREVLPKGAQYIDYSTWTYFNPRLENRPEYTISGSLAWIKEEWGTSAKLSGYYFAPEYTYKSYGNNIYEEIRTDDMSTLELRIAQEITLESVYAKVRPVLFFEVKNLLNSVYDRDGDGDTDRPERQFVIGFDIEF